MGRDLKDPAPTSCHGQGQLPLSQGAPAWCWTLPGILGQPQLLWASSQGGISSLQNDLSHSCWNLPHPDWLLSEGWCSSSAFVLLVRLSFLIFTYNNLTLKSGNDVSLDNWMIQPLSFTHHICCFICYSATFTRNMCHKYTFYIFITSEFFELLTDI